MNLPAPYPNIVVKNGRFPLIPGYFLPRSTVVITAGPEQCLYLFRMPEWLPIRERLLGYRLPEDHEFHLEFTMVRRLLIGYSQDVQISGRGIIGLDEELLDYAGIRGRLLWVPGHKGIELWSPNIFDESKRTNLFSAKKSDSQP